MLWTVAERLLIRVREFPKSYGTVQAGRTVGTRDMRQWRHCDVGDDFVLALAAQRCSAASREPRAAAAELVEARPWPLFIPAPRGFSLALTWPCKHFQIEMGYDMLHVPIFFHSSHNVAVLNCSTRTGNRAGGAALLES